MDYSRRRFLQLAALLSSTAITGCGTHDTSGGVTDAQPPSAPSPTVQSAVVRSEKAYQRTPDVPASEIAQLSADTSAFAYDVYESLRGGDGNLFFSPFSILVALAMTYVGARGTTEQQMAQALHYTLPQEQLHHAFNALTLKLETPAPILDQPSLQITLVNSIWVQTGYVLLPTFLDVLAEQYDTEARQADFAGAPEAARETINAWVSEATEETITDLLPRDAINLGTVLVLVNAVYFNGQWQTPFEPSLTKDDQFYLLDGSTVTVPTMALTSSLRYAEGDNYQVVELPYTTNSVRRELSMVVVLPTEGQFADFEAGLDAEQIASILATLEARDVALTMPKLTLDGASFSLKKTLTELGMPTAFSGDADFSGLSDTGGFWINDVYHQAFVRIDEFGTEASAATAVVMAESASLAPEQPTPMLINRPFLFFIHSRDTGVTLFLGRVLDPIA